MRNNYSLFLTIQKQYVTAGFPRRKAKAYLGTNLSPFKEPVLKSSSCTEKFSLLVLCIKQVPDSFRNTCLQTVYMYVLNMCNQRFIVLKFNRKFYFEE